MTKLSASNFPQVERLLAIMAKLRDPNEGCPWDKQQTFDSIVPYTIEEVYEVADAIEKGDMHEIQDELGDLLFQVVFYAQLGKEQQHFDFEAIAETIADKLERRHPHVFGEVQFETPEQVAQNWQAVKQQERSAKGQHDDNSVLANIPSGMAPLLKAHKIQQRCAKVGFDWPSATPVFDKVNEELCEVRQELQKDRVDPFKVEEEIGDLLFAVVNLARHLDVNAESALRKANNKFEARFRQVELALAEQGVSCQNSDLNTMENIWREVKERQKTSGGNQ